MSFIAKLKTIPLPPLKNIINVAVQTARQTMPDKKDYEQPGGNGPQQAFPQPTQEELRAENSYDNGKSEMKIVAVQYIYVYCFYCTSILIICFSFHYFS